MHAIKLNQTEFDQLPDSAVVSRILSGEKVLFELLLRRHNQKLYRVIRSYLRDHQDIEDTMQETYLKAFNKLDQFRGDSGFSTWLIRIGINEALQRIKKNKNKSLQEFSADSGSQEHLQLPDPREMNPEKIAIGKEMKNLIESAIDTLPEKYRLIYVLKEVQGMETAEMCACLGITENNAKVRIHRAKILMKERLLQLSSDAEIFEFGNSRCDSLVNKIMRKIGVI
jgi:RNA polymerase sigma factor (sigma-70 family)